MPCLNEAAAVAECVRRAFRVLERSNLSGEVIVVDNGSSDGSGSIAADAGARVVCEPQRGYGNAYRAGLAAAEGTYVVMADADLTYDFEDLPRFVAELDAGADLVMGDRMNQIEDGAMRWMNRYIGNPLISKVVNLLFHTGIRDSWCGMRAVRRAVLPRLDLRSGGMEFAVEMVVRASDERLAIRQIDIALHPRIGESKLSPFRDGTRALRFLLSYNPTRLFMIPGALTGIVGAVAMATVLADITLLGRQWFLHTMIAGSMLVVLGAQMIALGVCGREYLAGVTGRRAKSRLRIRHWFLLGMLTAATGLALGARILVRWSDHGFGELSEERLAVLASTLVTVGVLVMFVGLLVSMLRARSLRRPLTGSI